ncbi:MAG: V-type ATP synthase subunit D [Candidatus Omnitrophica bacterium]|nr:V-type ATP synthase subunit D [Candidatus Omnitrophota bacterium]
MPKVKLTKGELKRQRDALKQYERYLPTLQLKKQQLQLEIHHQEALLKDKTDEKKEVTAEIKEWAGLLSDKGVDARQWIAPGKVNRASRNIAGVELPLFRGAEFQKPEYDLFIMPLWVDAGILELRKLVSLLEEIKVAEEGIGILKRELRVTTQRVNLFEKVKIPEAKEVIRLIKIYIGDQMANAVGRSKTAKRKIEESILQEAAV